MKIKIDNYEIYKDDCLVVMEGIPCESVGLIVTDPPYLMDYKSNRRLIYIVITNAFVDSAYLLLADSEDRG